MCIRDRIQVKGTVEAVNRAFHLSMQTYQHPTEGRTFYGPDREPTTDLHFACLLYTSMGPPSPCFSGKFLIFQALAGWRCPQNPDCTGVKYQNLHCKGLRARFRALDVPRGGFRRCCGPLRFVGWFDCAPKWGNNVQIVGEFCLGHLSAMTDVVPFQKSADP